MTQTHYDVNCYDEEFDKTKLPLSDVGAAVTEALSNGETYVTITEWVEPKEFVPCEPTEEELKNEKEFHEWVESHPSLDFSIEARFLSGGKRIRACDGNIATYVDISTYMIRQNFAKYWVMSQLGLAMSEEDVAYIDKMNRRSVSQ